MKMRHQTSGSALLMVLVLSSCIMLIATVALRSSTLFYEIALDRVAQFEQLHAAQALAYYGIAHCMARGENALKTLSFDRWPPPDGPYAGSISIEPKKKGYRLVATLSKQSEQRCVIQSEIIKQKGGWRMACWEGG